MVAPCASSNVRIQVQTGYANLLALPDFFGLARATPTRMPWVYRGALLLALLLAAATTKTGDDEGDDDLMVTPTPSSPS